jgi:hypothetical protein
MSQPSTESTAEQTNPITGPPPEPDPAYDPMVQATQDLKDAMDTFLRAASLLFPKPTTIDPGSFAMFQVALQLRAQRTQQEFYADMTDALAELLARTTHSEGALDARAETRIMARQRIGIAMGPDPETMRELALASQHELAMEMAKNTTLISVMDTVRAILKDVLAKESLTEESRQALCGLLENSSEPTHETGEV